MQDADPNDVAAALAQKAIFQIIEQSDIPRIQVKQQDVKFATWLLSSHPVVVKGFHCSPPITPVIAASQRLRAQLEQLLEVVALTASDMPNAVVHDDVGAGILRTAVHGSGWQTDEIRVVYAPHMRAPTSGAPGHIDRWTGGSLHHDWNVLRRPLQRTTEDNALPAPQSDSEPTDLDDSSSLLVKLRSYALQHLNEHVLSIPDDTLTVSPATLLYARTVMYMLQSSLDPRWLVRGESSAQLGQLDPQDELLSTYFNIPSPADPTTNVRFSSRCDDIDPTYEFDERDRRMLSKYAGLGLWYIPLVSPFVSTSLFWHKNEMPAGVPLTDETPLAVKEVRIDDVRNHVPAARCSYCICGVFDYCVVVSQAGSIHWGGVYPPHTWRALQEGLVRTQKQFGTANIRNLLQSPMKTREEVMRAVLLHACAYWNEISRGHVDDATDCTLLQIGLPITGALIQPAEGSPGWDFDQVGKLISEDDVMRYLRWTI